MGGVALKVSETSPDLPTHDIVYNSTHCVNMVTNTTQRVSCLTLFFRAADERLACSTNEARMANEAMAMAPEGRSWQDRILPMEARGTQ